MGDRLFTKLRDEQVPAGQVIAFIIEERAAHQVELITYEGSDPRHFRCTTEEYSSIKAAQEAVEQRYTGHQEPWSELPAELPFLEAVWPEYHPAAEAAGTALQLDLHALLIGLVVGGLAGILPPVASSWFAGVMAMLCALPMVLMGYFDKRPMNRDASNYLIQNILALFVVALLATGIAFTFRS